MAVLIRAFHDTGNNSAAGADIALVINKPTGTVDTDYMLAFVYASRTGASITPPAGWTLIDSHTASVASFWLYRKAASSEGSSYTFTISGLGGATVGLGSIMSFYDDAGSTVTLDVITESIQASADATADNTGVTPTVAPGSLLVVLIGATAQTSFSAYAVANNNPTWTEMFDRPASEGGGQFSTIAGAYASRGFITATGAFTATIANSCEHVVYLLSLKPAALLVAADVFTVASTIPTPAETAATTASAIFTLATSMPDATPAEADPDWSNAAKNAASATNTAKNAASATNTSKNSSSWTNQSKS